MSDDNELFEVIKNGPLRPGEALLTFNGQTFRIGIQNISVEYNYADGMPELSLSGPIFSNPDELFKTVANMREDKYGKI